MNLTTWISVFSRIDQEVRKGLRQAYRVGLEPDRMLGQVQGQSVAFCFQKRPRSIDRRPDHEGQLGGDFLQFERTSSNACNIEQVVQKSAHVRYLSLHDLFRALNLLRRSAGFLVCGQRVTDRSEWITQFVGEQR